MASPSDIARRPRPPLRPYTPVVAQPSADLTSTLITVRVRLFASYREAAGRSEETCELRAGSRVGQLVAVLEERFPRLRLRGSGLVAVNRQYVADDAELAEGDEVAFIPPVSGGACSA